MNSGKGNEKDKDKGKKGKTTKEQTKKDESKKDEAKEKPKEEPLTPRLPRTPSTFMQQTLEKRSLSLFLS
jgi:hypothetical protein